MSEEELNFIENYVRTLIRGEWRKLLNKLSSINDVINEAQMHCFIHKQKHGHFKNGNNTIKLICSHKIINYLNRDMKWFTNPGRGETKNRYRLRIPERHGFLRCVVALLDKRKMSRYARKMRDLAAITDQTLYLRGLLEKRGRKWVISNKELVKERFWRQNS